MILIVAKRRQEAVGPRSMFAFVLHADHGMNRIDISWRGDDFA